MWPTLTLAAGIIASAYIFLRFLLYLTQDAREPPAILTALPFVGPLIGMIKENTNFQVRLRNQHGLPIYTLRLPFQRIYIVNSTELIPLLHKQWRTVSFAAVSAGVGYPLGMSKEGIALMHQDLTKDHSFSVSWTQFIKPAMSPGEELDAMNRRAVEILATTVKTLKAKGTVRLDLWAWSRQAIVKATTEAVWGPQNPYRDAAVSEAWRVFEAGFLMFATFPMASIFFPKLLRARETVATAMTEYVRKGGPESASGLVRLRYEHHHERFGMSLEDIARGELGNTFAVLGNTAPCAFWLIYHIFSDDQVLADIRREVSALVYEDLSDDHEIVHSIDLAAIRDSSPILVSTLQETMRFRSVATSLRVVLEDVYLDNRYLLKKGSMLMIPGAVQHRDISAWGDNALEFDYKRFIRKPGEGQKMPSRIAFRAFGGGHDLCPGRHFASTEILVFAALLVLQYDLVPLQGKWTEPKCDNTPAQSAFPIPDGGLAELEVEFRPRDASSKWNIKFSGSDKAIDMASEDSLAGDI